MKKTLFLILLAGVLAGCASTEMPITPEGIDEMRISPCACEQLDYKGAKFKWLG